MGLDPLLKSSYTSLQVRAALAPGGGHVDEESFDLLELVASKEFELYRLFSQRQLQVPHLNQAFFA